MRDRQSTLHPAAPPAVLRPLAPEEELEFWREIYGAELRPTVFGILRDSFNILQVRSQMLLGLITICLTITGFSGIRIAAVGALPRGLMLLGILGVLVSAVLLFIGPLQVRWITQLRADTPEATIIALIHRRNYRTVQYHAAVICLLIGLSGYVLSVAAYLLQGGR
jgi:hypothetical protein